MYYRLRRFLKWIIKVNWYKTIRVNFGLLPFNQACHFPIIVTGRLIISSLAGRVVFDCPIKRGLVIIGKSLDHMPIGGTPARLMVQGELVFKGKCVIGAGSNLTVWPSGKIILGKYVMITSGVLIKSEEWIEIGDLTCITSGCFVQDTNVHLIKNIHTGEIKRTMHPIKIGRACWILMNSTIMGGTCLPDYCIVARNTFLNKNFENLCPPGSMLAGAPARVVRSDVQRVFSIEKERKINRFFREHPEADKYQDVPGWEAEKDEDIDIVYRL